MKNNKKSMFHKKTPKSEEPYKSIYVCHNPHTTLLNLRKWPDRIRIISIDPGITHFAIRVEERSIKSVGPITTLLFEKIGLKKDEQELSEDLVSPIYTFVLNFLDKHKELFKTCHMVLIEKQLPINYRAVRMSQNTLTYFMMLMKNKEPELPMFFEVAPILKGRELGVPPNLNERGLKLWAVDKAKELLTMRDDKVGLAVLNRKIKGKTEKKDDLSDSVLMIEALFSYFGWSLTQPMNQPIPKNIDQSLPKNIDQPVPKNIDLPKTVKLSIIDKQTEIKGNIHKKPVLVIQKNIEK